MSVDGDRTCGRWSWGERTLLCKVNIFQWDGKWGKRVSEWREIFLRNSQSSAFACCGEPVCSVMLFWPVDTSSSATTKGDSFAGRRETAFKQNILNVFLLLLSPPVLPVLWVCLTSAGYGANKAPLLWSPVTLYSPPCHCSYVVSTECKYAGHNSQRIVTSCLNFNLLSHTFSEIVWNAL